MMKNVTLSVEESVLAQARRRAAAENTTLDELFRTWLERYIAQSLAVQQYEALMNRLDYAEAGRSFTREEMNTAL
jgi:hypothetical protein